MSGTMSMISHDWELLDTFRNFNVEPQWIADYSLPYFDPNVSTYTEGLITMVRRWNYMFIDNRGALDSQSLL